MKTFYSIVYIPIRQIAAEQLAVGLFMTNGVEAYFHFSEEKLKILKKLLPKHTYQFLNSYLNGLKRNIEIDKNVVKEKLMSNEFLLTLSKHSNNILTMSKPVFIDLEVNHEN